MRRIFLRGLSLFASGALVTACGGGGAQTTPALPGAAAGSVQQQSAIRAPLTRAPLSTLNLPKYVVVMVQENRTVDNLFQTQPGVNTQSFGINSRGVRVNLRKTPLGVSYDCSHAHSAFDNDVLLGFDTEPCGSSQPPTGGAFTYVNPSDISEYTTLASDFAFADNVLQANEGPSFPAHLYLIAATTRLAPGSKENIAENDQYSSGSGCEPQVNKTVATIDMTGTWPEAVDDPQFPCITMPTIFNELDTAHIGWRYYTPSLTTIWNAPYAVRSLYTNDKANVITPETTILSDIVNGKLRPVSYVIPSGLDSDHPGNPSATGGPAWVGSVFNALTTSRYKSEFALIVVWDDWGGFFDHVPDTHLTKLPRFPADHPSDPYEYGYRVPLLAIGPFAKRHYVGHAQRDFTSIVHFIEDVYGLPSLGALDAQTDNLFGLFDFTGPAIAHGPIPTGRVTIESLMMRPPDLTPVDSE